MLKVLDSNIMGKSKAKAQEKMSMAEYERSAKDKRMDKMELKKINKMRQGKA